MSATALVVVLSVVALIIFLNTGAPALYAAHRGYAWYWWVYAIGMFALFIIASLPSLKDGKLSVEDRERLRRKGNSFGRALTFLSVAVTCLSTVFAAIQGARGDGNIRVWKSAFQPVEVVFEMPWQIAPDVLDSAERMHVAFVDARDGKSYSITVDKTYNQRTTTETENNEALKQLMLDAHEHNRVLGESDIMFHDARYHCVVFRAVAEGWGDLCVYQYSRLGDASIAIQVAFPIKYHEAIRHYEIPVSLASFDAGARVFEPPE